MATDDRTSPSEEGQEPVPTAKRSADLQSRYPIKAMVFGSFVAAVMALVGGALTVGVEGASAYGVTIFLALPVATGFTCACFARPVPAILLTAGMSILICFIALLATGLEGIVCICMATPLIFCGATIGALLGSLLRLKLNPSLNLTIFPLIGASLVFAVGAAENRDVSQDRVETITSVVDLDGTPDEVWNNLLTMEAVVAEKPLLMRIGLPVPMRCTLDGAGLGATRVCHFDSGTIEERVTEWAPSHRLELRVIKVSLPGRHWLGFASASYTIEEIGPGRVRVIRKTTITSKLRPGAYWRHFEQIGVESEHAYLFQHLARVLKERKIEVQKLD